MPQYFPVRFLFPAAALLLPNCSSAPLPSSSAAMAAISRTAHGIIGGQPVAVDSWQAKHTLVLFNGKGGQFCTASRIGPNQIITAGHCLNEPIAGMSIGYLDPHQATPTPIADKSLKVVATAFHPDFDTQRGRGKGNDHQDIGLIVFAGKLDAAIAKVAAFRDFARDDGELRPERAALVATGFGMRSTGDETPARLDSVTLTVDHIDSVNSELVFKTGTGKGTCDGDSGGPAFIYDGGPPKLIGVTSRSPDGPEELDRCELGNGIDTDARYYRAWLSCVSAKMRERFGRAFALGNMQLELEAGDRSASACVSTLILPLAEAVAAYKSRCEKDQDMKYDPDNGACQPQTKRACKRHGGTWDAKARNCELPQLL